MENTNSKIILPQDPRSKMENTWGGDNNKRYQY